MRLHYNARIYPMYMPLNFKHDIVLELLLSRLLSNCVGGSKKYLSINTYIAWPEPIRTQSLFLSIPFRSKAKILLIVGLHFSFKNFKLQWLGKKLNFPPKCTMCLLSVRINSTVNMLCSFTYIADTQYDLVLKYDRQVLFMHNIWWWLSFCHGWFFWDQIFFVYFLKYGGKCNPTNKKVRPYFIK